jgi:uncharacterized membrane protein
MGILILLNNFLHDFGAAGWLFGSIVLRVMLSKVRTEPAASSIICELLRTVNTLMRVSLVGIVVFGVVRALAYRTYEWSPTAGDGQVTLLLVKHVLLTGVFAWGIMQYLAAQRLLKKEDNHDTEKK